MLRTVIVTSLLTGALLSSGAASGRNGGRGGGNSYGEPYYNDMQRNPRLIEPGGERGRYLAYYGREGWDARQATARGYGNGYAPYGNVRVRPYAPYRYGY